MDPERIMELISVQRHDFLNHLQVISGLLQLNRGEQAREYIKNTAGDITRLSRVVHLKVPEAAAALLLAHNGAAERGVNVQYAVEADLDRCMVPGDKLGSLLETVLMYAVECLGHPENTDRELHVGIYAVDGGYRFRVCFNQPAGADGRCCVGVLDEAAVNLSAYGGTLQNDLRESAREISVFLPA